MRTVLITGATSGFGKFLVKHFLANGDSVIATGRGLKQRGEIFAQERTNFATRFREISLDVTNKNEIAKLSSEVPELDVLINNAGYGLFGALEETSDQELRQQMEVNFFGLVQVTQTLLPQLRKRRGQIFNFSSVFGFMGFPLTSVYCASKFAVEGLTESLRGELAPHGVKVCLIEPGGYRTNFGESIFWAGDGKNLSPYALQLRSYQSLRKRISARPRPPNPEEVAIGIVKLSEKKTLPLRVPFGKDAGLAKFFRNNIPAPLYFFILDKIFGKLFSRGA